MAKKGPLTIEPTQTIATLGILHAISWYLRETMDHLRTPKNPSLVTLGHLCKSIIVILHYKVKKFDFVKIAIIQ